MTILFMNSNDERKWGSMMYEIKPGVFSTRKPEPPKPEPVKVEEAPPKKKRTSTKKTVKKIEE